MRTPSSAKTISIRVSSSRQLYLIGITLLLTLSKVVADGLPYSSLDDKPRSIGCEYLSLSLSSAQVETLVKTGVVDFSPTQLEKLKRFYPKFPAQAGAFSSTHNDGVEPEGPEAYVIWWHADEVIITLESSEAGKEVIMPSSKSASEALFRLSPDGQTYHQAKSISLKDAFRLIDQLSAKASTHPDATAKGIVIPPPNRAHVDLHESITESLPAGFVRDDAYEAVLQIAKSLQTYSQAKGIHLHTCW